MHVVFGYNEVVKSSVNGLPEPQGRCRYGTERTVVLMKKKKIEKAFFRDIVALSRSYSGNPRYEATLVMDDGSTLRGKTATDASSAYGLRNYEAYEARVFKEFEGHEWSRVEERVSRYADVTYHETASGNIIFDYVTDHKE